MRALEQALRRHSESKLEGTEYLLRWDWIGLTVTIVTMNHRILEPERVLVTLLILQIRKPEVQEHEGEMRLPYPPKYNFSLENVLVRRKLSCYNRES